MFPVGFLPEAAKGMFVVEVRRVSVDRVDWVRREAGYALGALTKIVDDEMLHAYLVSRNWLVRDDPRTKPSTLCSFLYTRPSCLTLLGRCASQRYTPYLQFWSD
jgi:serine/threonine-protein phosphatase 4 regulatory subunit 1